MLGLDHNISSCACAYQSQLTDRECLPLYYTVESLISNFKMLIWRTSPIVCKTIVIAKHRAAGDHTDQGFYMTSD